MNERHIPASVQAEMVLSWNSKTHTAKQNAYNAGVKSAYHREILSIIGHNYRRLLAQNEDPITVLTHPKNPKRIIEIRTENSLFERDTASGTIGISPTDVGLLTGSPERGFFTETRGLHSYPTNATDLGSIALNRLSLDSSALADGRLVPIVDRLS